ncbi:MAG: peptidase [Prolixibacteraceae bacterium]|jgi:hypothetical protein|nr:peptidase [Prolixibacteraceae bacterium]
MVKITILFITLMDFRMKWLSKKNIRKWLRIIHRDLGYFVVGITLVYGVSGIILNHKETKVDPAFKTIYIEQQIDSRLSISKFESTFAESFSDYTLNRIIPNNNSYKLFLTGGMGTYVPETGLISFEVYKKKPLVYFMNKLHYNQKNYWTTPADFFGGGLIFLALSGLFMARGKKGFKGRGKWFALAGIILVILYIWL